MGLKIIGPVSYTTSIGSALGSSGSGTILLPTGVSIGIFIYVLRTSTLLLGDKYIADDYGVFGQYAGGQRTRRKAIAVVHLGFWTGKN